MFRGTAVCHIHAIETAYAAGYIIDHRISLRVRRSCFSVSTSSSNLFADLPVAIDFKIVEI